MQSSQVTAVNLTAAALITQFLLIIILFIGASILWSHEQRLPNHRRSRSPDVSVFAWVILGLLFLTMGPLLFTSEFSRIRAPLLGDVQLVSVKKPTAMLGMFLLNTLVSSVLNYQTGGSRESAFSPILSMLPALAILLRESFGRVILYAALIFISIWVLLLRHRVFRLTVGSDPDLEMAGRRADNQAFWFTTLACLALTTFVAYLTRPV